MVQTPSVAKKYLLRLALAVTSVCCVVPGALAGDYRQWPRESAPRSSTSYLELVSEGRYAEASALVDTVFSERAHRLARQGKADGHSLQLYLLKASALHWADDSNGALTALDLAEVAIKDYELRTSGSGALESIGSALFGSASRRYRPRISDGVMVNTLRAVEYLQVGRLDDARVELHRADERTRRALDLFEREIAREREANSSNAKINSDDVDKVIAENYPDLSQWEVYRDFVNPYSVYLHSIFFLAAGEAASDLENASLSMRRLVGMYPDSSHLIEQLSLIEGLASGSQSRKGLPDYVWVICADGLGPSIGVRHVRPTFATKNGFLRIDIRVTRNGREELLPIPVLQHNSHAYQGCVASTKGGSVAAHEIASMDRIMLTELKKRLPSEIGHSISALMFGGNSFATSWGKSRANQSAVDNILGSRQDTALETRSWQGLPKTWYALRVNRPVDGRIDLQAPDGTPIATLEIPEGNAVIVHVRTPSRLAIPAISTAVLSRQ